MIKDSYTKGVICINCFNFVAWSKYALEDVLCNRCKLKLIENEEKQKLYQKVKNEK